MTLHLRAAMRIPIAVEVGICFLVVLAPGAGQALSEQVFRVYAADHADIAVIPINANADVTNLISHAQHTLQAR